MHARIIEATKHGDEELARLVVHFTTDAGASVGIRTVDVPFDATAAQARAAVIAEWQALAGATIQRLIGAELDF